jgi:signal transduction histidine kinase
MAEAATGVDMQQPAIPLVTAVIAAYAIIAYAPLRRAIVGTVIVTVGSCAELLIAGQKFGNLGFIFTFVGLAWALGRITRVRTKQAVQAELQVERLRREQEDHARRVAAEERGRIARELHDVIAHSVSVMVVQAGAAQQVMGSAPDAAVRALDSVQETGRQAIGELGRLLGVLRDAGELGLAPQPTLAELDQLVADARAAGLPVSLRVTGAKRPLPTGVELAVYRIVQEALTNTRKHAGPASSASVVLAYGPDDIAVEVCDDGRGAAGYGTGHGLVGMRERVSTYGGTLATGRAEGGGFSVRARIPVSAS